VELNAEVVAFLIGEKLEVVQAQIERMCSEDPKSRTKAEGGRRLIKKGEFEYWVVNGDKYRAIRDEESRRQQNVEAQRRHREKKGIFGIGGLSIKEAIKRKVDADPITLADQAAVAGLPRAKLAVESRAPAALPASNGADEAAAERDAMVAESIADRRESERERLARLRAVDFPEEA
jgi:hypothetical protein